MKPHQTIQILLSDMSKTYAPGRAVTKLFGIARQIDNKGEVVKGQWSVTHLPSGRAVIVSSRANEKDMAKCAHAIHDAIGRLVPPETVEKRLFSPTESFLKRIGVAIADNIRTCDIVPGTFPERFLPKKSVS
jgi:hypothetical protein